MVNLKPLNWNNIETHYRWNNDKELAYYDSDYPHHIEPFESFVQRMKSMNTKANESVQIFEITDDLTGELIGVINISGIDKINKKCLLESVIGEKPYRNKGYGSAAVHMALDYCFNELEMNKVSSVSFDFNTSWIHVLEKTGFIKEGCLRNHVIKNDSYCDKIIYSQLATEYQEKMLRDNVSKAV